MTWDTFAIIVISLEVGFILGLLVAGAILEGLW